MLLGAPAADDEKAVVDGASTEPSDEGILVEPGCDVRCAGRRANTKAIAMTTAAAPTIASPRSREARRRGSLGLGRAPGAQVRESANGVGFLGNPYVGVGRIGADALR